jgi:DNA-binding response OmpR family regulator
MRLQMVNNLLIVEDDADLRMILADVLADEGFEVITASDGVEAQEVLLRLGNSIGCVLLDWNMPRMTGIELLEWMKTDTRWNGIPVVFLTGATDPGQIRRGIEAGAFYYLTKPALPTVVLSIIRSAVDDRRYKERLHELLATCQNPLGLLLEGSFEFRSIRDAERLATIIANASPEPQRALVINEIFVNAVEHGNLGISYEEKGALLEAGTWYDEVERRLKLPEHSGKSVRVEIGRAHV